MKTGRIRLALVVLFAHLFLATSAFAFTADSVLSHDIKEADGTSGQNTGTGSGVKTGHIQDGAVTDAKIGGTISQSKVTGLEAALAGKADVTHNHDVLYQQKYGKVAVVSQTGGDYADPVAAMNGLAAWCGTPSAANPCLVKIMPGVYTLGSSLQMQSYVDVEGSGANTTKLSGTVDYLYSGNNELRMVTVESAGTSIFLRYCDNCGIRDASVVAANEGVRMEFAGNSTLRHVNISVSSGEGEPTGIYSVYPNSDLLIEDSVISVSGQSTAVAAWGFRGFFGVLGRADLYIKDSKIAATGAGVCYVLSTMPYDAFLTGSDLVAEGGIYSWGISGRTGLDVTVKDSTIKASTDLIQGGNIKIANSRLEGPAITNKTSLKCFGVYDGNYDPFVCQ